MLPTERILILGATGLLGLSALTGCSSSVVEPNTSTSSATTAAAQPTPSVVTTSPSPEPAFTNPTTIEPTAPANTQQVTAPKNQLRFAVPQNWQKISAEDIVNDSAAKKHLDQVAQETGTDAEGILAEIEKLDVMLTGLPDETTGYADSINVNGAPVAAETLPLEEELSTMVTRFGATSGEYQTLPTPMGRAASILYTTQDNDKTVHGSVLVVPAGTGSGFTTFIISSSKKQNVMRYVNLITQSVESTY